MAALSHILYLPLSVSNTRNLMVICSDLQMRVLRIYRKVKGSGSMSVGSVCSSSVCSCTSVSSEGMRVYAAVRTSVMKQRQITQ